MSNDEQVSGGGRKPAAKKSTDNASSADPSVNGSGPAGEPLAELADERQAGRPRAADLRRDQEAIRRLFETGEYPYKRKLRRKEYEQHKAELQV